MSILKEEKNTINLNRTNNDEYFKREEKSTEKTPAFNQLLQLQLLIQKQAGLKELCKKKNKNNNYIYNYSYKRSKRHFRENK